MYDPDVGVGVCEGHCVWVADADGVVDGVLDGDDECDGDGGTAPGVLHESSAHEMQYPSPSTAAHSAYTLTKLTSHGFALLTHRPPPSQLLEAYVLATRAVISVKPSSQLP